MQTQRDHVHAHQFQMARMSSALILGDPSMAVNPMKRAVLGLFVGLMIAVLALVAFGVYGWIVPGGKTSWRKPGAIIVEKESGTRYVFVGGKLHPTLNMASAMIINGSSARVELVSRNSLKGVPHGVPVGIPGAPQVLPAQNTDVVGGPWLVCLGGSLSPRAGQELGINFDPKAPVAPLSPERFMLVADGEAQYLIWRDQKHRITDDRVPVGLGVTNAVGVPAPKKWLNGLPAGPELGIPTIPGEGERRGSIGGRPVDVGQLFTQRTAGDEQLFVLREDGLAPINRTMFQLLQAGSGVQPIGLDAAAVAATDRSEDRSLSDPFADLSAARWESGQGRVLCQRQAPVSKEAVSSSVVLTGPENSGLRPDGTGTVALRPGSGIVIYPVPFPRLNRTPEPHLVADLGLRYALPDREASAALKLVDSQFVPFPRDLLDLIPTGPALTRAAIVTEQEG